MDLVTASAADNTVSWFRNDGSGHFGAPQQVTYKSNGARIVTTGDIDADGKIDIIVASYDDHTVGWFKNDGTGEFGDINVISSTATNAQGVTVADIDGDGDLDVISASSGDNTIAWYENLGQGRFCEVKRIVDSKATGARTVVAGDFDGDGYIDLASASKDDNTVAWYPNSNGKGEFAEKRVISDRCMGAYSLFPFDVDQDGHTDLLSASNADDTVALFRNLGDGYFERMVIADDADFALSVFAADLDNDGDIDVASASYFDGEIRWYENMGNSSAWIKHTLYQGSQGHYVSGEDLDGDGDVDLIASTTSENTVATFVAVTSCNTASRTAECCRTGQQWNGSVCAACESGKYGIGIGVDAVCVTCPTNTCSITGLTYLPITCTADCVNDIEAAYAACDCAPNTFKTERDVCAPCPEGQKKSLGKTRTSADFAANRSATYQWHGFDRSLCTVVPAEDDDTVLFIVIGVLGSIFVLLLLAVACFGMYNLRRTWVERARAQQRYHSLTRERIAKACRTTQTCMFNVCFIRYATFKKHGKLTRHEIHRELGELFSFDTYEEVFAWVRTNATVFISHQWLGFTAPDPDNVHFPAICSACESICAKTGLAESDLYIWVDYVSIPQSNNYLKALSISSLAVYASIVRYFVIVAPSCIHRDTRVECNSQTYSRRGWCRLEQWARMTVGGLKDMYLYEDGNLEPLLDKPHWYTASVKVFEGDFTVESDKHTIVDPVMGLWYIALVNSGKHEVDQLLLDLVNQNKETVFPVEYFEDYIEKLEGLVEEEKSSQLPHGHPTLMRTIRTSRSSKVDNVCSHPVQNDSQVADVFA
mmetsp:Transcript_81678/g.221273  ORF Transcript_81678/g.221273 Transcript_81678/m.221273 type:complete len:821 (-) Transcript_81678:1114-3576(-)